MKANKIIVGLLVLIGFGSCCNRPSKSKASETNNTAREISTQEDSLRHIRVMYGPPRPRIIPENRIREAGPAADSSAAKGTQVKEEPQTER